ncbi:hypothetical protein CBB2_0685 [Clostridium botulinum]|nr:hypothetical protein CBB2_0685 [Clostridium botulinum]
MISHSLFVLNQLYSLLRRYAFFYYFNLTNGNYIIFTLSYMVIFVTKVKYLAFLTLYYSIFKEHSSYFHFQWFCRT